MGRWFSRKETIDAPHEKGNIYSDGFKGFRYINYYDYWDQLIFQDNLYPKGYVCPVCDTLYADDQINCQNCNAKGVIYD